MNNLGMTAISLALTTIVVGNAYYQKKQFYPSVVYITKSNTSMAIMYVQALNIVLLVGKLMKKVFFGELRAAEFEHLIERSWYAVTETCLAFTVFREDFSAKFVALFILLFFLKAFHWLAEDRVDFMERSPAISVLFHLRIITLLSVLATLDYLFVELAYHSTLTKGASVQLVFGFEYAILLTIAVNIGIKYILHSFDLHSEVPWENKAVLLLYTELIMGLIKVILYFLFVMIMVRIYTLPLFAFRPMYYTLRAFKKAFNDVILSRRAIRNMNTLYPDATPEELAAVNDVCIICHEDMRTASKKLPCNHIFHTACLRSWFQRQQTCPICRLNILRTPNGAQHQAAPEPPRQEAPPPMPNRNRFMRWPDNHQRGNDVPPAATPGAPGAQPGAAGPSSVPGPSGTQQTSAGGVPTFPQNTQFPMPPQFPFPGPFPTGAPGGQSPNLDFIPYLFPPFTSFPFGVSPPMPPFDRLSEEELRQLERTNREGLEARVQCLRNIQSLLDTTVFMMQQYVATVSPRCEALRHISTQTEMSFPDNSSDNEKANSVSKEETKSTKSDNGAPEPSSTETPSTSRQDSGAGVENSSSDEASELRRRRLARFSQQTNGSSS